MQCGNLLNWVANSSSTSLAESLWKNEMRVKAAERFSDFDSDEVRKLIDRDWKVMSEEARNAIASQYNKVESTDGLRSRAV